MKSTQSRRKPVHGRKMRQSVVKLTEGFGIGSIDDKLEFYELIDMDAEGDDQTFHDMMSSDYQ
ncbi:hypothetical protein BDR03DRAFT_973380 [Suillus americanus]|nr:hypothetical protein BDR03DRAFT_973380 [Suillus americanus]